MKRIILLTTLILLSLSAVTVSAFGASYESRRAQLIQLIDEELSEVLRIQRGLGRKSPDLMLRQAELFLEKGRLIREEENEKYLSLSPKRRQKISKNRFFNKSHQYFIQAQKSCVSLLKHYPTFKGRGHVYYIMAFNAKEFKKVTQARKYFAMAIKYSRRGSEIRAKSGMALAEIYYNETQYAKAIPLYVEALKTEKGKWYTKDLFNLSWCYFRTGKQSKAIQIMRKVYELSQNSQYMDMQHLAARDLAYFFADAKLYDEAISFFKSNQMNVGKNLLKMGKHIQDGGKVAVAARVYEESAKYAQNDSVRVDALIALLGMYQKFNRYDNHLTTAERLLPFFQQNKMDAGNKKIYQFQLEKMSGVLQNQVAGKVYAHDSKLRLKKADQTCSYYKIMSKIQPEKKAKYDFICAETYFAAGNTNEAIGLYDQSFDAAKSKKMRNLSLNGFIASLGAPSLSKEKKDQYLEKGYKAYLQASPKGKKAFKIYQRLFTLYFDKKDIPGAERTLLSFRLNFPKSWKKQEAMLAKIMDHYKAKGDKEGIRRWVKRVSRGEFKINPAYAKKLNMLLLTMQFDDVEKATSVGDKKKALRLYHKIYRDKGSSKEAKKNAAYNIAVLFFELGDADRTYQWSVTSLKLMTPKDVKRFYADFMAMAQDLFNQRRIKKAAILFDSLLFRVCKEDVKHKAVLFKNAHILYAAAGNRKNAERVISKGELCKISPRVVAKSKFKMLEFYLDAKRWNAYEKLVWELSKNQYVEIQMIEHLEKLRNQLLRFGKKKSAWKAKQAMFDLHERYGKRIDLDGLDIIANYRIAELESKIQNVRSIRLRFPEKSFNSLLQKKFKTLDEVTGQAFEILDIGSGKALVKVYAQLVDLYKSFADELEAFTPPKKSAEYVTSFKQGMLKVSKPLRSKMFEFKGEAIRQIEKFQILDKDNWKFLSSDEKPFDYSYYRGGIIMDRGGQR